MPSRADIVIAARTWLDVPWTHQGRTRHGIDCAGLVIMVAHGLGLTDYVDNTAYQRRTSGYDFLLPFRENMVAQPVLAARPGDVLLFRDGAYPCHSALVAGDEGALTIVHAYARRRRVVEERLDQGDWLRRRVACFSFRGVGD